MLQRERVLAGGCQAEAKKNTPILKRNAFPEACQDWVGCTLTFTGLAQVRANFSSEELQMTTSTCEYYGIHTVQLFLHHIFHQKAFDIFNQLRSITAKSLLFAVISARFGTGAILSKCTLATCTLRERKCKSTQPGGCSLSMCR